MNEAAPTSYTDFVLPANTVTQVDIARLVSEFEQIDNQLTTVAVRAGIGVQDQTEIRLSEQLTEFLNQNNLRPSSGQARTEVKKQLRKLKDTVQKIHVTFASEPDAESLRELITWLRTSIHPHIVIAVGLQPGLVAGVYVRTPNHVYDLSLKAKLQAGRSQLVEQLGLRSERA